MDVFKATNSNELASLSQSPVNRIIRRPLTTIEEDSPIQKQSNKISWDTRSTPLRTKDELNLKRDRQESDAKPVKTKTFKRYKSSPQLAGRDDKNKMEIENFKQLLLMGGSVVKPRNLMENLDRSLNDSVADGPLINGDDENKISMTDDFDINYEDLDRIEAEVLVRDSQIPQSSKPEAEIKNPVDVNPPEVKEIPETISDDDDFSIDFNDLERIEAEAMEKFKKEEEKNTKDECDELLMVESIIEWSNPGASSTQFTQFRGNQAKTQLNAAAPSNVKKVSPIAKPAPPQPAKSSLITTPWSSKPANPVTKTDPSKTSKLLPVFPQVAKKVFPQAVQSTSKPFTVPSTSAQSSTSNSTQTLSDAEKLRIQIQRNKEEAMRRRQIFLENQQKMRQNGAIKK